MSKPVKPKKISQKIGFSGKEDRSYVHDDLGYVINKINELNIEQLSTALRLSEDGKRSFLILMSYLNGDIQSIHATEHKLSGRDEKIERLNNLNHALQRVQYECSRSASQINDLIPEAARAEIGKALTFSASTKILKQSMFPINDDMRLQYLIDSGRPVTVKNVEEEFLSKREAIGLNHGGELFSAIIKVFADSLMDWTKLHAERNTNKKNIRYARNHIIKCVLDNAVNILGDERASARGEVTNLCKTVLQVCGIQLNGLESAIARVRAVEGSQLGSIKLIS